MDKKSIYKLTDEFFELEQLMYDDEIDEDSLQMALDSKAGEIKDKFEGYAYVKQNLESTIDSISTEIKRLQARKKVLSNRKDRMLNTLLRHMELLGLNKLNGNLFTFSLRKRPVSLVYEDEKNIPKEYYIPQEPKLDTATLKEDIKNGKISIEGVEVKSLGNSLMIK